MSTKILLSAASSSSVPFLGFALCLILCLHATAAKDEESGTVPEAGHLVKKWERQPIISTEFGQVLGVRVSDGNETFNIHLITLEPSSLFLPVTLHQDMVFYVHTGSGKLSYRDEDNRGENTSIRRGDVYRLESGSVFFIESDLSPERQKLRIHAIFGNAGEDLREPTDPYGPYTSIRDLVLGFDKKILQETFKVPEEVVEEITSGRKPEAIVHGVPGTEKKTILEREYEFMEGVLRSRSIFQTTNKDKKKSNLFNIFREKRDFENCNGWSTTVTQKKSSSLKDSKYGFFMVNLTHGGMMGPHWNPRATEIAIVLQGRGMVRVVCPSLPNQAECKDARFGVEEGDVFVVPRHHAMAQMAFNNDTFVFIGFSTSAKNNHPQYLAGKASVLRTLDSQILAASFGVNETTFDRLVNQQRESVILECTSCAEEEWRILEQEIEREREEARQREEEETRREEERRREEEEAKRREEEEAKRREEEAAREREEEERKKREQEEAARRQREEEAERERREQEEREARERKEEAARRQREEEAARERREEEEREARQREEEAARRQREEEAARERREEEEREKQQQQEEAQRKREQEEREARQRQEEEARERREQEERAQEQAEREAEAAARREEEAARRQEEEAQRQQEEAGGGQQGGSEEQPPEEEGRSGEARQEEEAAKQQEEEIG